MDLILKNNWTNVFTSNYIFLTGSRRGISQSLYYSSETIANLKLRVKEHIIPREKRLFKQNTSSSGGPPPDLRLSPDFIIGYFWWSKTAPRIFVTWTALATSLELTVAMRKSLWHADRGWLVVSRPNHGFWWFLGLCMTSMVSSFSKKTLFVRIPLGRSMDIVSVPYLHA
jgi:hypothetical protein